MIDLHSHILPGLDDGSQSFQASIKIAKAAVKQGVDTIVATPKNDGKFMNDYCGILTAVAFLNKKLVAEKVPLTISPGQEILLYKDMIKDLENKRLLTLNETSYCLIKLPSGETPTYMDQILFDMQIAGFKPVIAHPEQNLALQMNPNRLYELVKQGALMQVDTPSMLGVNGKKVKKFAIQMFLGHMVHVLGTNTRTITKHGYTYEAACKQISKYIGVEGLELLLENNQLVLDNKAIYKQAPERIKNDKRIFGIF